MKDPTPLRELVTPGDEWIATGCARPVMLIPGVLPRTGTAFVIGKPKSGKSWLAFDLAISVANGLPFLGYLPIELEGREHGRVLYLSYEGSEDGARARFRALLNGRGIDAERGMRGIDIAWRRAPFLADGRLLTELADDAEPWDLVIIDTLSKAWEGEENSNSEAAELMRLTERVAERGSLVIYVHHTPKGIDGGGSIRGASAFHGATDATLRVERRAKDAKLTVELRDDAPTAPIAFVIHVDENDGSAALIASLAATDAVNDPADRRQLIRESVLSFVAEQDAPMRDAIKKGVKHRNEDVIAELDELIRQGFVTMDDRRYYVSRDPRAARSHVPTLTGEERGTHRAHLMEGS